MKIKKKKTATTTLFIQDWGQYGPILFLKENTAKTTLYWDYYK